MSYINYSPYANQSYYQPQQQYNYAQQAYNYSDWTAYPNSNQYQYYVNAAPYKVTKDDYEIIYRNYKKEKKQDLKTKKRIIDPKMKKEETETTESKRVLNTNPSPSHSPSPRPSLSLGNKSMTSFAENESNTPDATSPIPTSRNSINEYRPVYSPENEKQEVMTNYPYDNQPSGYNPSIYNQSYITPSNNQAATPSISYTPSSYLQTSGISYEATPPPTNISTSFGSSSGSCPQGRRPVGGAEMITQRFSSDMEKAISNSKSPIQVNESEIIEIPELGIKGIWLNRAETLNWKGGNVPISQYKINLDSNFEKKKLNYASCVERVESLAIKYLKPPQPPKPGDLIITQQPDYQPPEAPPLIIRQLAPEPVLSNAPVVLRERPPQQPEIIPAQEIIIPGKQLEPPTRRVIVEKLAKQPDEIRGVTVERWLPYEPQQRCVIFNKASQVQPLNVDRNVEFIWEPPCVDKKTKVENLGVEVADPVAYNQRYSGAFINSVSELPEFARNAQAPGGINLNATQVTQEHTLTGEIDGLRLVDLNREGLGMYRKYL